MGDVVVTYRAIVNLLGSDRTKHQRQHTNLQKETEKAHASQNAHVTCAACCQPGRMHQVCQTTTWQGRVESGKYPLAAEYFYTPVH
jgi:hypothetical protein